MTSLDKKGYRIAIDDWVGNLGNHLIQISGGITVAMNTQSTLTTPDHWLLGRLTFDFTDSANRNCMETVAGRFFFQTDCFQFPIVYDRDRRKIFQDHLLPLLARRSLSQYLHDALHRRAGDAVAADTLVINMRSGKDIFRSEPPPQNDYMQPPLSFYKHIIETNNYADCLIVTEPDRKNPCIEALLAWNPGIRLKTHRSVRDDLRTLLGATHLVTCHSSFSWCMALMSNNLQKLYQSHSFQIRGVRNFSIDTYFLENYIKPGEWTCSPQQLVLMLNHSSDNIWVDHKPRTGSTDEGEVELSHFW